MPPDMVLHACTGTGTGTSLICGVISSIRKALPLFLCPGKPALWGRDQVRAGGQEE